MFRLLAHYRTPLLRSRNFLRVPAETIHHAVDKGAFISGGDCQTERCSRRRVISSAVRQVMVSFVPLPGALPIDIIRSAVDS
jgi:hypothetical protein